MNLKRFSRRIIRFFFPENVRAVPFRFRIKNHTSEAALRYETVTAPNAITRNQREEE